MKSLALVCVLWVSSVVEVRAQQQRQGLRRGDEEAREMRGRRNLGSTVTLDNFNSPFDPDDPDSDYFFFQPPDSIISQSGSRVTQTSVPHTATVPQGDFGTLDHLKTLLYRKDLFTPSDSGTVQFELTIEASIDLPASLPFGSSSVSMASSPAFSSGSSASSSSSSSRWTSGWSTRMMDLLSSL